MGDESWGAPQVQLMQSRGHVAEAGMKVSEEVGEAKLQPP